jgi:16S rRNA G966 N2-methylase RsmD
VATKQPAEPKITRRTIADYLEDHANANKGSERGLSMVEESLSQDGAGRSIVVDAENRIVAGNKTWEASALAGIEDVIEVETDGHSLIVHKRRDWDLTDVQGAARRYAYRDNRASEVSLSWSAEQLLADVNAGFDFEHLFSDGELAALLAGLDTPGELQEVEAAVDRAAELRNHYGVEVGQVWRLGRHRLACIDSCDEAQVTVFLDGVDVGTVFADPPYGIEIVAANVSVGGGEAYDIPFGGVKNRKGLGSVGGAKPFGSKATRGSDGAANIVDVGKYATIIGDDTTETAIKAATLYTSLYPDASQIWWGANYYANALAPSSCWLVWDKENTGNFADVELAWTNIDKAARIFRHMWNGMVKASEHGQRRVHPTQKPVALAAWCFEEHGGGIIVDPFAGSGISIIAAEQLKRTVYAMELSPDYVAVIIQRWVDMTGLTPELQA